MARILGLCVKQSQRQRCRYAGGGSDAGRSELEALALEVEALARESEELGGSSLRPPQAASARSMATRSSCSVAASSGWSTRMTASVGCTGMVRRLATMSFDRCEGSSVSPGSASATMRERPGWPGWRSVGPTTGRLTGTILCIEQAFFNPLQAVQG